MGIIGSVVEFDLDGKTAGDLVELYTVASKKDMLGIAKLLAKFVSKCPAEWGDPASKDTYYKGSYFEITKPVWNALVEQVVADAELPKDAEIAFMTDSITGEQMGRIWTVAPLDFQAQAKILPEYTVAVAGIGGKSFNPTRPEDYLKLNYKVFRAVWNTFVNELNSKN